MEARHLYSEVILSNVCIQALLVDISEISYKKSLSVYWKDQNRLFNILHVLYNLFFHLIYI